MLDVRNLSLTTKFTKKAQSLTKNIVIEEFDNVTIHINTTKRSPLERG